MSRHPFNSLLSSVHRQYKKIEVRDHQLLYLFLEITTRCNLSCLHCGSDCGSQNRREELTTDSWKKIIRYMSEHFSSQLVFVITGGEPLLHPDLPAIGREIRECGRRWGMVSNGYALRGAELEELKEAGLFSITISFDGPEEAHNRLRNNPHAFERAYEALGHVAASGLKWKDVVTCVYPGNLELLDRTSEILLERGISSWRLFRIFPSGRAEGNRELLLDFGQTNRLLSWIASNRKRLKKRGLELNYSCEGWMPPLQDRMVRRHPFFCRAGVNIASILSDGNITGCSNNHASFFEGNILDQDFKTLWDTGFQNYRKRPWLKETLCRECDQLANCYGSSLHLWKLGDTKPGFCYYKE